MLYFALIFQVNVDSLKEYIKVVVEATTTAGICRQLEAFKSGFNQVHLIKPDIVIFFF
jgi:23S rRNA U2552 (ribose-2'-O)-methylase RlmE/FtsJ